MQIVIFILTVVIIFGHIDIDRISLHKSMLIIQQFRFHLEKLKATS